MGGIIVACIILICIGVFAKVLPIILTILAILFVYFVYVAVREKKKQDKAEKQRQAESENDLKEQKNSLEQASKLDTDVAESINNHSISFNSDGIKIAPQEQVNTVKHLWIGKNIGYTLGDYVVTDIETTGLNAEMNSIIEISAIKVVEGNPVDTFSSLIYREKPLNKKITDLTGITSDMLRNKGMPLKDAIEEYDNFIGDLPLVGHNIISFDIKFLNNAYAKTIQSVISNDCVDTYLLARKYISDSPDSKLQTLAEFLKLNVSGSHRAMADCQTTQQLYEHIKQIILDQKKAVTESLNDVDKEIINILSKMDCDLSSLRFEKKGTYLVGSCFYPIFRFKTSGRSGTYVVFKNTPEEYDGQTFSLETSPATSADGGGATRFMLKDLSVDLAKIEPLIKDCYLKMKAKIEDSNIARYKRFDKDYADYLTDLKLIPCNK